MFLLKPKNADQRNRRFPALHSTMFLLKLFCLLFQILILFFFTFHNVSIKTRSAFTQPIFFMPLHSTMFLLKRDCGASSATGDYFTFHNVSIKTRRLFPNSHGHGHSLHSTMFLLKRWILCTSFETGLPLHSTMFLLKLSQPLWCLLPLSVFTFHNVSIKTCTLQEDWTT